MADTTTDFTAPDFMNQATQKLGQLSQERQRFVDVLNTGTQDFVNTSKLTESVITNLNAKAVDEGAKLSESLNKLAEIQTYPKIVQNIGRMLGIDAINPDLAETKAKIASQNIQTIAQQEENAVRAHTISTQMIRSRVEMESQRYTAQRQEFTDMTSAMQMALTAKELKDKTLTDKINGMDLATLQKTFDDITHGKTQGHDKILVDNVGALQRTIMQIQQQQNTAALQGQQIDLNKLAIAERTRNEEFLKHTPQALKQMLQTKQFPAGMTEEQARQELQRREGIDLNLENARIQVQAGNMALSDKNRANAIRDMNLAEVSKLREAAKGGSVVVDGIKYNEEELKVAYDKKLQALREDANTKSQLAAVAGTTNLQYNEIAITRQRLENMTMSAGERDAELIALGASFEHQISIAMKDNNVLYAQKLVAQYKKEMDALAEKRVKTYPEEWRAGAQEYLDTGKIANPANAAKILNSMGKDQFGIAVNGWDGIWKKFSETSTKLANDEAYKRMYFGTSKGANGKEDFDIVKMQKTDPELHIRNVINKSNLLKDFRDVELQNLIQVAAMQGRLREEQVGAVSTVFSNMVDRNGDLQQRFYGQDKNGNLVWEPQKLFEYLATETRIAREKGILKDNEDYGKELTNAMKAVMRTPAFAARYSPKSVNEAAFLQMFGHEPINHVQTATMNFARTWDTFAANRLREFGSINQQVEDLRQPGQSVSPLVPFPSPMPTTPYDPNQSLVKDFFKLFGGSK